MSSKPFFTFRSLVPLAALSTCALTVSLPVGAMGLGGTLGAAGATFNPGGADLLVSGRAQLVRHDPAHLPRGERLRDAAGSVASGASDRLQRAQGADLTGRTVQGAGSLNAAARGMAIDTTGAAQAAAGARTSDLVEADGRMRDVRGIASQQATQGAQALHGARPTGAGAATGAVATTAPLANDRSATATDAAAQSRLDGSAARAVAGNGNGNGNGNVSAGAEREGGALRATASGEARVGVTRP